MAGDSGLVDMFLVTVTPMQGDYVTKPVRVQILIAEFGDDTFILAAIMAMRHPRLAVFLGALSAEAFMAVQLHLALIHPEVTTISSNPVFSQ